MGDSEEGEQEVKDENLEEYDPVELAQMPDFNDVEAATRFVEDVTKIRGSAGRRLQCMRRVVDKLCGLLRKDMEQTAEQAHAVLHFCGSSSPTSKEVPIELETLIVSLSDFIKVFRHHWEEVRADLPSYQQLFGDPSDRGSS